MIQSRMIPTPGTPVNDLDTPALLLDLDIFEANIERMSGFFREKTCRLRPHAKTHKCPQVALRQISAGACGITCAKVSEAEVFARAGVQDILIANQVTGQPKVNRLAALAGEVNLMVAIDREANLNEISQACKLAGTSLRILVEVDLGMQRCGVEPGQPVLNLARKICSFSNLTFSGIQAYEGHLVFIKDPEERAEKVKQAFIPLVETAALLEKHGLPASIVSGGGTGTYDLTGVLPPYNEVQAGSYVFMDSTNYQIRPEFRPSLSVLSTILSRPVPGRLIIDAGMKALTHEFGLPTPIDLPNAKLTRLSEEHGRIEMGDDDMPHLRPGEKIRILPSHCCTTTNLYDVLYVIRDERLVDIWEIAARGCNQ
ncbi:MAG TPA: DSD1 family PLP-dependent enzyme [Anaerolineaceae bacterium]